VPVGDAEEDEGGGVLPPLELLPPEEEEPEAGAVVALVEPGWVDEPEFEFEFCVEESHVVPAKGSYVTWNCSVPTCAPPRVRTLVTSTWKPFEAASAGQP